MPFAGFFSRLLSLVSTLMPTQAGDYDQKSPQLSGLVAPNREEYNRAMLEGQRPVDIEDKTPPAEKYARRIKEQSRNTSGGGRYGRVWAAMVLQSALVVVILIALYYGQAGGVVI